MNESKETNSSGTPQFIRCLSCRSAINESLDRCPYCGQRTVGTEQKVTTLDLAMQMRARSAERKKVNQCALCGKKVSGDAKLCRECDSKESRKNILIVILASLVIFLLLWFFT